MLKPCSAIFLALLAVGLSCAQPAPSAAKTGTISGQVIDVRTGLPIASALVGVPGMMGTVRPAKADPAGRYTLRDVPPGSISVEGTLLSTDPEMPEASVSRTVTLGAGQDLTSIDLRVRPWGRISGRVVDENDKPIPGVNVALVARGYSHGALRYFFAAVESTDSSGQFHFGRVEPGRAYLLMVGNKPARLEAFSGEPDDPRLRKAVTAATYYPGVADIAAASRITLQPGESRERVDVTMVRSASFCVAGKALTEPGSGPSSFQIELAEPNGGEFDGGGGSRWYMGPATGKTGPDGAFRICGLTPGTWRLAITQGTGNSPAFTGSELIAIADSDIHDLEIPRRESISMPGEVVWDGTPPDKPVDLKLIVTLQPFPYFYLSAPTPYVTIPSAKATLPGEFSVKGLTTGEYATHVAGLSGNTYVEDMRYGDSSVLRQSIHVAAGGPLRIVVARDGGFVQALVSDKEGCPVADSWVIAIPVDSTSDAEIADSYVAGQTDQTGLWKSRALAPGKYYVWAMNTPPDKSPETITRLMLTRLDVEPIDIPPSAAVTAKLVEKQLQ